MLLFSLVRETSVVEIIQISLETNLHFGISGRLFFQLLRCHLCCSGKLVYRVPSAAVICKPLLPGCQYWGCPGYVHHITNSHADYLPGAAILFSAGDPELQREKISCVKSWVGWWWQERDSNMGLTSRSLLKMCPCCLSIRCHALRSAVLGRATEVMASWWTTCSEKDWNHKRLMLAQA